MLNKKVHVSGKEEAAAATLATNTKNTEDAQTLGKSAESTNIELKH